MRSVIDRILGTRSLSSVLPPEYTPLSLKTALRNVLMSSFAGVFPVEHPVLVNISGLPASGKSYWARIFKATHPEYLYLSFDAIMEQLPPYRADCARNKQKAFERWEMPARFIGYHVLTKAVAAKLPILFEHSNATPDHLELYQKIKDRGYAVDIRFIQAEPYLVLPRLEKRNRYFSPNNVLTRWETLQGILPELRKISNSFTLLKAWKEQ